MGKRDKQRRARYGDRTNMRPKARYEDTISAYRPVFNQPERLEPIKHIQDYIVGVLRHEGIHGGVSRIALNGLRMTMLPTQDLRELQRRTPALTSSSKVQKHITGLVPTITDDIRDVQGTRGVVLGGNKDSFAAFVFEDERLMDEQVEMFEAVGRTFEEVRVPTMGLVALPPLPYNIAQRLNTGLSVVAENANVSVGPVMFDIRSNH